SQRSKKDDVQKISTSVFVTNFPGGYCVRDLWNTCKLYGHVVDVFIHDRRTKAGEGVCIINKFKRVIRRKGWWWSRNTFSCIASRWGTLLNGEELEDEGYHSNRICIRTKLKMVVFDSFKMVYRGMTCWVRAIEVPDWVPDFEENGEEGYDVNDGSHEDDMYGGVSENLKDVEGKSDREEVPKTNFEEEPDKSIFEGNSVRKNDVPSEDPFGIYEVLNKKRDGKNIDDKHEDSLKYPPGFTPNEEGDVLVEKVDNWSDENRVNEGKKDRVCEGQHVHERGEVSNDTQESTCSGHFKKSEVPHKGGSILELIDDLINVRQTMGYDMTGCIKNMRGLDTDGHRRQEVVWLIQEVENVDAMKVNQKAKIKWSIEGEKKSKDPERR
nr:nucleotide-binding alpha-beta plait domain-containing protein [Tanacetum cinerariifolium]